MNPSQILKFCTWPGSKQWQWPWAGRLTSDWCPVHDLILGYCVVLVVHIGTRACCFPLDDVDLHVLDFDSHQQEVYLPYNDIFQVVSEKEKKEVRQMLERRLAPLCASTGPTVSERCEGSLCSTSLFEQLPAMFFIGICVTSPLLHPAQKTVHVISTINICLSAPFPQDAPLVCLNGCFSDVLGQSHKHRN